MKDILVIMEQTCRQDIKKLCFVYSAYFLCMIAITFTNQTQYSAFDLPCIVLSVIAFLAITRVHGNRMKRMVADGAFHRILLLPIKRATLPISEFLFTFASYAILITLPLLVFHIWFLMFQDQLTAFLHPLALYAMIFRQTDLLMPFDVSGVLLLVSALICITLIVNYLLLSFCLKMGKSISVAFSIGYINIFILSDIPHLVKCGIYIVLSISMVVLIMRMMNMRRRNPA